MKNIISLFLMAFLIIGTLGFVVAADGDVPEPRRIGFFETSMDQLRVAFTFNKEVKIEKTLEIAEKRLAEAELLAEEDPEAYEEAQARYAGLVANAEEILADIESGDNSTEGLEQIARIQNRFEKHRDQADEIYARARERFEMNNASEEKLERFEMFHERALERSELMEEKAIAKREMIVEKHEELSSMSEDEREAFFEEINEREGLTADREERQERLEVRTQEAIQNRERMLEETRARLGESDLSAEERLMIKNKILEEAREVENLKAGAEDDREDDSNGKKA